MKTRVVKDGLDWVAWCEAHGDEIWCSDWLAALEAAYGHVAMWHPRNLDTQRDQGEGDGRG